MSCYPYAPGFFHLPTGPTGPPTLGPGTIEQALQHHGTVRLPTGITWTTYPLPGSYHNPYYNAFPTGDVQFPAPVPTGATGVLAEQIISGFFAEVGESSNVAHIVEFRMEGETQYHGTRPRGRLCQVDCVGVRLHPWVRVGHDYLQIMSIGSSRLEVSLDPDFSSGYFVESTQTATADTIAAGAQFNTRTGRDEFHDIFRSEWGILGHNANAGYHGYTDFIVFTGETAATTMETGQEDFFTTPLPSWNNTGLVGFYKHFGWMEVEYVFGPFSGATEFSYFHTHIAFGSFADSTDEVLEEFDNNATTVDKLWLGVADSKALARAGKTWFEPHAMSDEDKMKWDIQRRYYRITQRGPTGAEEATIHVPGRRGTKLVSGSYWLYEDATLSTPSPIAMSVQCVDAADRHTTESMKMPTGVTGPAELFWGDDINGIRYVNSPTGMEANSYLALRIPGVAPFDQPAQPAALSIGCQAVGKDLKISFTHIPNGEQPAGDRLPRAKVFSAGGVIGAGDVTPHDWGMEGTLPTRDAPSLTRGMTLEQYADAMNAYREYLYTEHADNYPLCAEYEWHRVRFVGPNEPWQKYGTNGSTVDVTCPSVANSNTYLGMSGAESSQSVTIDNSPDRTYGGFEPQPLVYAVNQFFYGHQDYIPIGFPFYVTEDEWTPPSDPNPAQPNPDLPYHWLTRGSRRVVTLEVYRFTPGDVVEGEEHNRFYAHPLTESAGEVIDGSTIRQNFTVRGLPYTTYRRTEYHVADVDHEPDQYSYAFDDGRSGKETIVTTSTTTRRKDRQALWDAVLSQCGHAMFESCQYTAQLHEVMATVRRDQGLILNEVDPTRGYEPGNVNTLSYGQASADPSIPMHYLLNSFEEQTHRTPVGGKIDLSHRKTWKIEAAVKTAKVGLDGELSGELLDHGTLVWPGGAASTKNFTLYDELKWTDTVTFTEAQWQSLEAGEAVTKTVSTPSTMDYGAPYFLPNYSSQVQFTFQFV